MKKKIGIIVVLVILVLIAVLVKCCFFSETRSEELEKIKQDIESRYEDDIDRLNYANELIKQRISHSIQLLSKAINNDGNVSDASFVVEALSELKLVNAVVSGLLPSETADGYFNVFDKK